MYSIKYRFWWLWKKIIYKFIHSIHKIHITQIWLNYISHSLRLLPLLACDKNWSKPKGSSSFFQFVDNWQLVQIYQAPFLFTTFIWSSLARFLCIALSLCLSGLSISLSCSSSSTDLECPNTDVLIQPALSSRAFCQVVPIVLKCSSLPSFSYWANFFRSWALVSKC